MSERYFSKILMAAFAISVLIFSILPAALFSQAIDSQPLKKQMTLETPFLDAIAKHKAFVPDSLDLNAYWFFYEEKASDFSFDPPPSKDFDDLFKLPSSGKLKTLAPGNYWARLQMKNTSSRDRLFLLELAKEISHIKVYFDYQNLKKAPSQSGSRLMPSQKELALARGRNGFLVPLPAREELSLYVHFHTRSQLGNFRQNPLAFESYLWDWEKEKPTYEKEREAERIYAYLFLAFALYHLLIAISIWKQAQQRNIYLFYAGSIFLLMLSTLSQRHLVYEWMPAYWGFHLLRHLSLAGAIYVVIRFTELYLNPPNYWKGYFIFYKRFLLLVPLYVLLEEMPSNEGLAKFQIALGYVYQVFINLFNWSLAVVLVLMSLDLWRKGKKEAIFYFLSFSLYFIIILVILIALLMIELGGFSFSLKNLNPYLSHINLALNTGILLCFSLGVGYRMNQMNNELRAYNQSLEQMVQEQSEEKNNLIHILTHNLKNQLDIIYDSFDFLASQKTFQEAGIKKKMTAQKQSLEGIDEMIKRIWQVSQQGKDFDLVRKRVNLEILLEDILLSLETNANKKSLTIDLKVEDKGLQGSQVWGDLEKMELVIKELLTNAIKYSPLGGSIQILLEPDKPWTKLSIRDEGPGIPPSEMEEIFQKYKVGRSKPSLGESSTGLGLYYVKKYTEAMGGSVSCKSRQGNGASFCLVLKTYKP